MKGSGEARRGHGLGPGRHACPGTKRMNDEGVTHKPALFPLTFTGLN